MATQISRDTILSQIKQQLLDSARVKEQFASECKNQVADVAELLVTTIANGHRIMLCGNGGSAADAQHIAAELIVRLNQERRAIPALALTTDTSTLTALGNDYNYQAIFVRQVEAFGAAGDVLIGISTSGNSENVIEAFKYANDNGIKTVALTGGTGGKLIQLADYAIIVPSNNVQRIQETHITVAHILCDLLEQSICDPQ